MPFGQDGSFSEDALFARLDADLANDLGNLVNRTLSMIERYCQGRVPAVSGPGCAVDDEALKQTATALSGAVDEAMARLDFSGALEAIMRVVTQANRYIEAQAPWSLAKQPQPARLHGVLNVLAEVIRIVAVTLEPFTPSVAAAVWQQLGCGAAARRFHDASRWPGMAPGQAIGTRAVLFPKPELARRS